MAKAKAKAAPKKETPTTDETITREDVKEAKTEPTPAPSTPKASSVEKNRIVYGGF